MSLTTPGSSTPGRGERHEQRDAVRTLTLTLLPQTFAVCRLDPAEPIPSWAVSGELFSVTRTPTELSVICQQANIPAGVQTERNWRCLAVAGPLDFSLTGILASLAAPLAATGVAIFAVSTYDTDYLLVKDAQVAQAMEVLTRARHQVRPLG